MPLDSRRASGGTVPGACWTATSISPPGSSTISGRSLPRPVLPTRSRRASSAGATTRGSSPSGSPARPRRGRDPSSSGSKALCTTRAAPCSSGRCRTRWPRSAIPRRTSSTLAPIPPCWAGASSSWSACPGVRSSMSSVPASPPCWSSVQTRLHALDARPVLEALERMRKRRERDVRRAPRHLPGARHPRRARRARPAMGWLSSSSPGVDGAARHLPRRLPSAERLDVQGCRHRRPRLAEYRDRGSRLRRGRHADHPAPRARRAPADSRARCGPSSGWPAW